MRLINSLQREFQSTLPRGSDNLKKSALILRHYFNPRSLAGATNPSVKGREQVGISIHAPSRERPNTSKQNPRDNHISIHAPSRERPSRVPRLT